MTEIEILEKLLDAKLKPVNDLLQEHHRTLFGNGTEGNQGLRVDMDRIKQVENSRKAHFLIIYTALVGGAFKAAYDWITSR